MWGIVHIHAMTGQKGGITCKRIQVSEVKIRVKHKLQKVEQVGVESIQCIYISFREKTVMKKPC